MVEKILGHRVVKRPVRAPSPSVPEPAPEPAPEAASEPEKVEEEQKENVASANGANTSSTAKTDDASADVKVDQCAENEKADTVTAAPSACKDTPVENGKLSDAEIVSSANLFLRYSAVFMNLKFSAKFRICV